MIISPQLRKPDFRFVLLKPKSKIPFEKNWQTTNNYSFDDPKLLEHIANGGNYGVIGGYGNLRILDIDNKDLAKKLRIQLNIFAVETGAGGLHFYFISEYAINHVLADGKGELRAKAYQVVGAGSIHPNGSKYKIINDAEILNIVPEDLLKIIKPHMREGIPEQIEAKPNNKIRDDSRSGKEFREVLKLISQGKTKEQVFKEMQVFAKWSEAHPKYCEITYSKALQFIKNKKTDTEQDKSQKTRKNIDFEYRTEHLPHFNNLMALTLLEGYEYIPIIKGLYYFIIGIIGRDKKIKIKKLRTDLRNHLFIVISSGQGKKNIKNCVKNIFDELDYSVHVPASLHPEQLIGKVIDRRTKKSDKPNWVKNKGYLSRDVLIFDEAYKLLTSKEEAVEESRKNIRISKDPYGENEVEKKSVDNTFDEEERLTYHPKCSIIEFTQPKPFNSHIVEDGDLRRDLVLYVRGLSSRDKSQDYKNRLKKEVNTEEHLKQFCGYLEKISKAIAGKEITFTNEAIDRINELHGLLVKEGFNHSEQGYNFTNIIDWTLQDLLAKLSAIIAIIHGRTTVDADVVDLGFMDLIEFFNLQLDFIKDKIIGRLDYGEGWQGARDQDQECLEWLLQQGAISFESSNIKIKEFQKQISLIKKCSYSEDAKSGMARKHYVRFKGNKWIDSKQMFQGSRVWITFTPKYAGNKLVLDGVNHVNGVNAYKSIINNLQSKINSLSKGMPLPHSLKIEDKKINTMDTINTIEKTPLRTKVNKRGQVEFKRDVGKRGNENKK